MDIMLMLVTNICVILRIMLHFVVAWCSDYQFFPLLELFSASRYLNIDVELSG